jgi:hypothetical protein
MSNLQAIFLGFAFGLLAGGVVGTFLFFTRSARRVRNALALGLGYILVGGSALGSILLLFTISDHLGVSRRSAEHYSSLYAYTVSYATITFLAIRAELRWRKRIGLQNSHPVL